MKITKVEVFRLPTANSQQNRSNQKSQFLLHQNLSQHQKKHLQRKQRHQNSQFLNQLHRKQRQNPLLLLLQ